ncbi:MAG TPA: hypothetical protein VKI65_02805 [Gemmataceae bacterium]|nr:hypothetical protein [Gemmataceae bacterium]
MESRTAQQSGSTRDRDIVDLRRSGNNSQQDHIGRLWPSGDDTAAPGRSQVVPEIEAEDLDGQKFKLSDYRGKVVLIDFWGHW